MKLKWHGARGSIPSPGPDNVRFGGNTSCLEIIADSGAEYIFDAGSGIRMLGKDLMKREIIKMKLFVTHDHWDHIQGFPFFVPAYVPGRTVEVFSGDKLLVQKLSEQNKRSGTGRIRKKRSTVVSHKGAESNYTKDVFQGQQDPDRGYFPVRVGDMGANITFKDLKEYEVIDNGLRVSYMYHNAHPGGMFSYKIQEKGVTVVHAGDYEHDGEPGNQFGSIDEKMIEWAQGADIFIMDGQYTPEEYETKKGWGHSQIEQICELAGAANVRTLIVTHHDPDHDDIQLEDMEKRSQRYMREAVQKDIPVVYAREGMVVKPSK